MLQSINVKTMVERPSMPHITVKHVYSDFGPDVDEEDGTLVEEL